MREDVAGSPGFQSVSAIPENGSGTDFVKPIKGRHGLCSMAKICTDGCAVQPRSDRMLDMTT
ncbi:hypothetical protein [Streptomyces mirabilis]|uniref:Uncharacterized protein n=1 Tax=Streptomyces mirabilis TaxID=68239 RepID=A0ABU3UTJ7_9ACTN|nr:hypothetical protein [Streptomyces mirabilis]MDU8997251.1 hypothetical protein [Streptomyces mirabilis]